jgi:hypothetical protein
MSIRDVLVILTVALFILLTAGAGLIIRSFIVA